MTASDAPGSLLLMLLDSRAPAGAHNHSAGLEAAVTVGMVRDPGDVEAFCLGRLRTSGRVAADFAAAGCRLAAAHGPAAEAQWAVLDAEFDARTPSAALRAASRQLGRGLWRLVRAMLPTLLPPWGEAGVPHQPIVLGAAVAAAGGDARLAARAAALSTVTVPASAAVRLLGLDPFAVQGMLARLAPELDAVGSSAGGPGLAADAAPALDLLADYHLTTEVRLFAS